LLYKVLVTRYHNPHLLGVIVIVKSE
jgi:hypothetical protein